MRILDWLESIRATLLDVEKLNQEAEQLEAKLLPGGGIAMGAIGSVARDRMDPACDAAELRHKADLLGVKLEAEMSRALEVIYGRSGRGGIAKARSYTDADILVGYYLQGLTWIRVATEMCDGYEGSYPAQWCRSRAMGTIACMERIGLEALADS